MDISTVRLLYAEAATKAGKGAELAAQLKQLPKNHPHKSIVLAYQGSAEALMARDATFPLTKLSHLNNSKKFFSDAVSLDNADPEIRMLRVAVQQGIPTYLNMSQDMEGDIKVVLANLHLIVAKQIPNELLIKMVEFVEKTGLCSAEELNQLKALWS